MRKLISSTLALALALGLPVLSSAQATGAISGTLPPNVQTGSATDAQLTSAGNSMGMTSIGPNGTFTFPSVPPGDYVVKILNASGNVIATSQAVTVTAGGVATVGGWTVVAAAGGGMSGTTMALIAAGAVGLGVGIYFVVRNPSPSR